ncbi:MAG: hypothetical protein NPINA01_03880 [Nitrospinaceae bacterium]|nr:MAG: hypothetical protein NPINA01_03880 [Nitrospinaceae bacterium]
MVIEMRVTTFHLILLITVLALAGTGSKGFAFSFGGVEIHSKFGERFNADLDLIVEENGDLEVQVGDEMDYRRLELDRPAIVDDLLIEVPSETKGRRKTVRVFSNRPLFYPSFNLVVRGTFKGGTVLERYLVTVDFKQSLALNVVGPPKTNFEETFEEREQVDLLEGGEAAAETSTADKAQIERVDRQSGEAGENSEIAPAKASKKVQVAKNSRKFEAFSKGVPPSAIRGQRGEDSFFPGATWVSPIASIPPMPPMDSPLPDDDHSPVEMAANEPLDSPQQVSAKVENQSPQPAMSPQEKVSVSGATYGPLVKGENLLSIAHKLNLGSANTSRIAVALWMNNPESFVYGNMNGLKKGSRINLENLEERLKEIDSKLAKQILRSQSQEWKIIREKLSSRKESEGLETLAQEIPLPLENEDERKRIFQMLQSWKASWENGDLEKHLSLFSDQDSGRYSGDIANLRFLKQRMFARHKEVKLGIKQASLALKGGQPVVSFGQSFSSGKMESYGLKDVGIVRENGAWKILKEKFKVNEYLEKSETSPEDPSTPKEEIFSKERTLSVPYVIHASSHLDYQMATQAVNQLRQLGFNAYSSPVNISRNRKIYRVYVGRFSSRDLAQELVSELRKQVISQNAIAVKYPFTFLMGDYEIGAEAEGLMHILRAKGFSPLLFTFSEKEFLNPRFRVLLGAFRTEKDSARLSAELNAQKFSFELLAP